MAPSVWYFFSVLLSVFFSSQFLPPKTFKKKYVLLQYFSCILSPKITYILHTENIKINFFFHYCLFLHLTQPICFFFFRYIVCCGYGKLEVENGQNFHSGSIISISGILNIFLLIVVSGYLVLSKKEIHMKVMKLNYQEAERIFCC